MNIQFKKGVLEIVVLYLLSKSDMYGYELVENISENIDISEGTIYPLLRRLNKENLVTTYLKESTMGPPRKYYQITKDGNDELDLSLKEWREFVSGVEKILSQKEGSNNQ